MDKAGAIIIVIIICTVALAITLTVMYKRANNNVLDNPATFQQLQQIVDSNAFNSDDIIPLYHKFDLKNVPATDETLPIFAKILAIGAKYLETTNIATDPKALELFPITVDIINKISDKLQSSRSSNSYLVRGGTTVDITAMVGNAIPGISALKVAGIDPSVIPFILFALKRHRKDIHKLISIFFKFAKLSGGLPMKLLANNNMDAKVQQMILRVFDAVIDKLNILVSAVVTTRPVSWNDVVNFFTILYRLLGTKIPPPPGPVLLAISTGLCVTNGLPLRPFLSKDIKVYNQSLHRHH